MKFIHLVFILLLLAGCKGCDETATPENKKPEPTTDGRNTFYCEINGKPYYQKFVGGQPSYPTITGAASNTPDVEGMDFRITYPNGNSSEHISFFGSNIRTAKKIYFPATISTMYYWKKNGCDFSDAHRYKSLSGHISFSRYDHQASIYSGIFNLKIWLPDTIRGTCDTVKITNGIFDLKLGS